jgi:hypothetical protein
LEEGRLRKSLTLKLARVNGKISLRESAKVIVNLIVM